MNLTRIAFAAIVAVSCVPSARATILDDFNSGYIITDFLFDDPSGTQIPDVANSANPALTFDADADSAPVVTNGLGQLDASAKNTTSLGTNYVDLPTISSGRLITLFEVSWEFDELVYDPAEDEEFRVSLITNDPRSTFITAQTYFQRTSATEVTLFGDAAGAGALDTSDVILASSGRLLTLLDADIDAGTFDLYYSADNGASFSSPTAGIIAPGRGVESLRLVINEDYSNDSLLIDRVAVSWSIPEPTSAVLLLVSAVLLGSGARRQKRLHP